MRTLRLVHSLLLLVMTGCTATTAADDNCGSNTNVNADGTCACVDGFDWCSSDPNDLSCCYVGNAATDSGSTSPDAGQSTADEVTCGPHTETIHGLCYCAEGWLACDTTNNTRVCCPAAGTVVDRGDFRLETSARTDSSTLAWNEWTPLIDAIEANLQRFNTAYALPSDVPVLLTDCGAINAYFASEPPKVVLCHELLDDMDNTFFVWTSLSETERYQAVLQAALWVLDHEIAHAYIRLNDVPVVGREEDAADQFSTLKAIENGEERLVTSAALYWYRRPSTATPSALADEHGLSMQRFYNMLCLLYGSNPSQWSGLATEFPEMSARIPRCQQEYTDAAAAWSRLTVPFVN